MAKDEPSWLPVSCSGCGQRWYGIERAHCPACHRTFADVALFDQHRVGHECRSPSALGMARHATSGIWEPRVRAVRRPRAG